MSVFGRTAIWYHYNRGTVQRAHTERTRVGFSYAQKAHLWCFSKIFKRLFGQFCRISKRLFGRFCRFSNALFGRFCRFSNRLLAAFRAISNALFSDFTRSLSVFSAGFGRSLTCFHGISKWFSRSLSPFLRCFKAFLNTL